MSALKMLMSGAGASPVYIDDVFSTYVRTGTGAEATVTNNIDMTEGYMLWSKGRSGATDHAVYDSERGVTLDLVTNSTAAETTQAQGLKSVSSTGYTIGTLSKMNTSAATYVDWVFRKAPRFFDAQTVTLSAGNATVDFSGLDTLGMVMVERTDSIGSWYVWHRSLTAGKLLYLEQTAAEATLGHITVSGTTLTLVDGVLADGDYVCYGFAHDPLGPSGDGSDGLIACGSYTGNSSTDGPEIDLGWEPQYILVKDVSRGDNWVLSDSMRALTANAGNDRVLLPNSSSAEDAYCGAGFAPAATGFKVESSDAGINNSGETYIYMAIRRGPMRTPESATDVFAIDTGTGSTPSFISDFPVDMAFEVAPTAGGLAAYSRLMQGKGLPTYATASEWVAGAAVFDNMIGWNSDNRNSLYLSHMFRRAPGFFDVVCYTGYGSNRTVAHNLGVAPEMMIVKKRSDAADWAVFVGTLGAGKYLQLNENYASGVYAGYWNDTEPTGTAFTVGTDQAVNTSSGSYIAYLFATLPGISKVGSHTSAGVDDEVVDCGFSTGARFVLIKQTSGTGSWFLIDSVRGLTTGIDPFLRLESTSAEETGNLIEPHSSGFIFNGSGFGSGDFIFLAVA